MPIAVPKILKCEHCKRHFTVLIGDVRPQRVECPHCKFTWLFK